MQANGGKLMKTGEAFNLLNFLTTEVSPKASGILGYAVAKNIRLLGQELTEYSKLRNDLIVKYGEKSGDGYTIAPNSDSFKVFLTEFSQYQTLDIDVDLMKVDSEVLINSGLTANLLEPLITYMEKKGE